MLRSYGKLAKNIRRFQDESRRNKTAHNVNAIEINAPPTRHRFVSGIDAACDRMLARRFRHKIASSTTILTEPGKSEDCSAISAHREPQRRQRYGIAITG